MIEMPNVIRTVTRSTMVVQYQHFCAEQSFEPLSRSTLFRILEIREASQRKSLSGLDNTAADGSKAFQTMGDIAEQLVKAGVDKSWSTDVQATILAKTIDYTLDIFAPFGVPDCQFISNDPPRPQNNVESLPNALNMLWDTIQH